MSNPVGSKTAGMQFKFHFAVGIVILLWLAYTVIYTLPPSDALAALLEFIPGVLGIGILMAAGSSPKECYLRVTSISRMGLTLLAVFSLFLIPILLTGHWTGWNWISALVYAPASGISQELFFRVTLLPAFMKIFKRRPLLAVSLHSALFALWHVPLAFMTAPLPGAVAVTLVTFLSGMVWGWQVQRDRTVVWAMAHHTLCLMIMSLFVWD